MRAAKAIFQVICIVLFVWLVLACRDGSTGMTSAELWENLTQLGPTGGEVLMWGAIIALQLSVMKWMGGVWNILFSLLSMLLMGELVMIAAGLQGAVTTPVYTELQAAGFADIGEKFPVIYWLLPLLWFTACLCARDQVRVFITAIVCYLLWLVLTMLCNLMVTAWLGTTDPAPAQMADVFRNSPWLTAALPGAFLLIYAGLMALFEACIPHLPRRKKKEESEPQS